MSRRRGSPRTTVVRPPLSIDTDNLLSEYLFPEHERAFTNKLVHSTSREACASILRDRNLVGSHPADIRYDGPAARTSPPSVHFGIPPASDGVLFPITIYPVEFGDAEETKLISLNAREVLNEQYYLFHASTTPTQFAQKFRTVYQSRVVGVHKSSPSLEFARENFLPLDEGRNRLLFFDKDQQLTFASKIMIDGVPRKHTVVVTIFGDIKLDKGTQLDVLDGFKCSYSYGKIACPLPGCDFKCRSMADLKIHYRALHLGVKVFECAECSPPKSFSQQSNLTRHIDSVHRRERPFKCKFCTTPRAFSQNRDLQRHISAFHADGVIQGQRQPSPQYAPAHEHTSLDSDLEATESDVFPKLGSGNGTSFLPAVTTLSGKSPSTVEKGLLTSQQRSEIRYSCPKCSRIFFRSAKLSFHMLDVHDVAIGHSPSAMKYVLYLAPLLSSFSIVFFSAVWFYWYH